MLTSLLLAPCLAALPQEPQFTKPERLKAGKDLIKVESPGYAAPCWHDVTGDGKIKVYAAKKDGTFAAGEWLQAAGKVAQVPGVW